MLPLIADESVNLSVYLSLFICLFNFSAWGAGGGGNTQAVNDGQFVCRKAASNRQHDILSCLRAVSDRFAEKRLTSLIALCSFGSGSSCLSPNSPSPWHQKSVKML